MDQLFLIRHGQTKWNAEGRYTGQSDIPLNEVGEAQALELVPQLVQTPPTILYSSDLIRALQTAKPIQERFSLEISVDHRLREINQGEWEGMHLDEIQQKFAAEFAAQRENPTKVGAPGGETVGQVQTRVYSALEDIIDRYPNTNEKVAVVCHGFVIALIRLYFSNTPIEQVWDLIPKNTEIIAIKSPARM